MARSVASDRLGTVEIEPFGPSRRAHRRIGRRHAPLPRTAETQIRPTRSRVLGDAWAGFKNNRMLRE